MTRKKRNHTEGSTAHAN